MPSFKRVTLKNRKFVRRYFENGGNAREAYKDVYNKNSKRPNDYGMRILARPAVHRYIEQLLDEHGISDKAIAQAYQRFLEIGMSEPVLRQMRPVDTLNALKEVSKLKDLYPAEKREIKKQTAKLNIDLKGKSEPELLETLKEVQKQIASFSKVMQETKKVYSKNDTAEVL